MEFFGIGENESDISACHVLVGLPLALASHHFAIWAYRCTSPLYACRQLLVLGETYKMSMATLEST
jgi:hypothetical protein